MARESIEERRARLMPGAAWLRAERERRGWTGSELARRLDVAQERVSAYERAQDEPPAEFIRALAEVFDMAELDVWRSLGKALPREVLTDEAVIARAMRLRPDVMEKMGLEYGFTPPRTARPALVRDQDVTRTGEAPCSASYG